MFQGDKAKTPGFWNNPLAPAGLDKPRSRITFAPSKRHFRSGAPTPPPPPPVTPSRPRAARVGAGCMVSSLRHREQGSCLSDPSRPLPHPRSPEAEKVNE